MFATPSNPTAALVGTLSGTPGATLGAVAMTSGTANAKGSWTALSGATTYDRPGFWLNATNSQASGGGDIDSMILDIGLGIAAAEQVVISNLLISRLRPPQDDATSQAMYIPIVVPAGHTIWARTQSGTASQTSRVSAPAWQGRMYEHGMTYAGADGYGIDLTNSVGTTHAPGASGTYSTWTDLPATTPTTRAYKAITLVIDGENATTTNNRAYYYEIGINSVTIGRWYCVTSTGEDRWWWPMVPVQCYIPSGTQLMVRGTDSGLGETQTVAFYGWY